MLIFNSENNFSKNLSIAFQDIRVKLDKCLINVVENLYVEVDVGLSDALEIEKLSRILSEKPKEIKIFPDSQIDNTYFLLNFASFMDFKFDINFFKIYCKNNIRLYFKGSLTDNFNENFYEFSKFNFLTQEEKNILTQLLQKQNKPHYFNDQNVFVENEYNRIQRILAKKSSKQADNTAFDTSVLKSQIGPSNPLAVLDKTIGLDNIKHEVKKLQATLEYRRQNPQIRNDSSLHMCFYGNPGTGKTTIARIMAGILFNLGFIKENKCVEVNGLELKGANVGQTSNITKSIIDFSLGGVLFIDEAYTLFDSSKNNFGQEAINTFLKEMEDNRDNLVVIFAGYFNPMQRLLDSNVGFRSRIKYYFNFEDYSAIELFQIFTKLLQNRHLFIEPAAAEKVILNFKNAKMKESFGNGRYVENFLIKVEEEHILNVSKGISKPDILQIDDIIQEADIFDL